jgi:hypothetical protein
MAPKDELASIRGFFLGDTPDGGRLLTEFAGDEVSTPYGGESGGV